MEKQFISFNVNIEHILTSVSVRFYTFSISYTNNKTTTKKNRWRMCAKMQRKRKLRNVLYFELSESDRCRRAVAVPSDLGQG